MSFVNLDSQYSDSISLYSSASTTASGGTAATGNDSTRSTARTSLSPAATVSISTEKAVTRDVAQLFEDIQSGSVANAQKDMTVLNQLGASQIYGADSSMGELLTNVQSSLGSGKITGAQSDLQGYLSSAVEQNVSSLNDNGFSASVGSTTDQAASASIETPEGALTMTTSTLQPATMAFFQLMEERLSSSTEISSLSTA
jgi:hypothetical protein